ncbi:MAG: hypothetical protein WD826_05630 [Actinomycetota bacterium]
MGTRLGVAVLLVWMSSVSAASAASAEGEFVALTYNVAGLPQGISGGDPTTNSPLISPLLNAYDVVLLQEDWRDPIEAAPVLFFHDDIVSEADHPYQSEPAPPPMGSDLRRFPTGPPLIADGLNQLARFPFSDVEHVMWETCYGEFAVEVVEAILSGSGLDEPIDDAGFGGLVEGGAADCGAQKGFTFSRLRLADGLEVDLYNLHGEAGSSPADQEASAAGFVQLATFMNARSLGRAVIVGGDTNLHNLTNADDGKTWTTFVDATGVTDVCDAVDCGDDDGEIDKFAFRSGGGVALTPLSHRFERERFKRSDGEPLSDHDALAVRFAWHSMDASDDVTPELPLTGGPGAAPLVAALLSVGALVARARHRPSR